MFVNIYLVFKIIVWSEVVNIILLKSREILSSWEKVLGRKW